MNGFFHTIVQVSAGDATRYFAGGRSTVQGLYYPYAIQLAKDVLSSSRHFMDEEIEKRLEESEEAIKEYQKQLQSLKEDLEIVIRFSRPNAVQTARDYGAGMGSQSVWVNAPDDDPAFRERCKQFAKKYERFEGYLK